MAAQKVGVRAGKRSGNELGQGSGTASKLLPAQASLENLRNQAKALQKQHRNGEPDALRRVTAVLENAPSPLKLHDAQFVLAREYGLPSWPKLVEHVEGRQPSARVLRREGRVWIDGVPRLRWGASPEPTYLGALEAAFRAGERPLDLTTLMGDSGLAFRLRWATRDHGQAWCGSGPCGEWPEEVAALNAATGYVFAWQEPERGAPVSPEHVQRIVEHIDRGWPILGFGAKHDMAVIFGYEAQGERLLLSDYWASEEPSVMSTNDAKSVGLFMQRIDPPLPRAAAVRAGLELALRRWREGVVQDSSTGATYHYGQAGYDKWILDLERVESLSDEQRGNLFFLNGWTYSSLYGARSQHAAKYLRAHAECLPVTSRGAIEDAARRYDELRERLGKWDTSSPMFGFVKQKKVDTWAPEVRAQEIELLSLVRELDGQAHDDIERALASM